MRGGRRTGERLQKVERGPLAAEQRARRAREPANDGAGGEQRAIRVLPLHFYRGIELPEHFVEPGRAGLHGAFAEQNSSFRSAIPIDERCRDVAGAQVLGQGKRNYRGDVVGKRYAGHESLGEKKPSPAGQCRAGLAVRSKICAR